MEVNHKELALVMNRCYDTNTSIDVKGATGVGKSFVVRDVAIEKANEKKKKFVEWNEISIEEKRELITNKEKIKESFLFVDIRLSQVDSSDLKGLPNFQNNVVEWQPNLIWKILSYPEADGIVFFDEMNLACFPAGTLINIEGGIKKIEQIKQDDKILNRYGQYEIVKRTMQRDYSGNLYNINATNLLPFEVTDDHPILTTKRIKWKSIKKPANLKKYGRVSEFSENEFIKAKDLTNEHFLVVPKLVGDLNIDKLDLKSFINDKDYLPKNVAINMVLNEYIAEFMGLYVAEGWSENNRIGIALGSHEKELIQRATILIKDNIYDNPCHNKKDNNCVQIRFTNKILSRAFKEWFGHGAKNKQIPDFILRNSNINILKAFIRGYHNGDGSFVNKRTISFATVSPILANQLQLAFTRFGILLNVNKDEKVRISEIKGRKIKSNGCSFIMKTNQNEAYDLLGLQGIKKQRRCLYYYDIGNYILTKIWKIKVKPFEGKVYNFETPITHTYVVNNAIVHNCPSVFASAYQIINDHQIGEYPISRQVLMISAGNRIEDKGNVFQEPAPLMNRRINLTLKNPIMDEKSSEDWGKWAIDHGVMPSIVGFLYFRPSYLFNFSADNKDPSFATPRMWVKASKLIEGVKDMKIVKILLAGAVGEGVTKEYIAFEKLRDKLNIRDILKHPEKAKDITELDLKYSLVSGIVEIYRTDKKILNDLINVGINMEPEFSMFMLRIAKTYAKNSFAIQLRDCPAWLKIAPEYAKYLL